MPVLRPHTVIPSPRATGSRVRYSWTFGPEGHSKNDPESSSTAAMIATPNHVWLSASDGGWSCASTSPFFVRVTRDGLSSVILYMYPFATTSTEVGVKVTLMPLASSSLWTEKYCSTAQTATVKGDRSGQFLQNLST